RQQVRAEQESDTFCREILEKLGSKTRDNVLNSENEKNIFFKDTDGILFRVLLANPQAGRLHDANQMVIPKSLVLHCISKYHSPPANGHRGHHKTLRAVQARCYFPGLSKKVAD